MVGSTNLKPWMYAWVTTELVIPQVWGGVSFPLAGSWSPLSQGLCGVESALAIEVCDQLSVALYFIT